MAADPKGYYAKLGLSESATNDQINAVEMATLKSPWNLKPAYAIGRLLLGAIVTVILFSWFSIASAGTSQAPYASDRQTTYDPITTPVERQQAYDRLHSKMAEPMSLSMWGALNGLLQTQYKRCWSYSGSDLSGHYVPEIKVLYNEDGALAVAPALLNPPSDPNLEDLADSAVRAVRECNPLKIPPQFAPYFSQWKARILRFDPEVMNWITVYDIRTSWAIELAVFWAALFAWFASLIVFMICKLLGPNPPSLRIRHPLLKSVGVFVLFVLFSLAHLSSAILDSRGRSDLNERQFQLIQGVVEQSYCIHRRYVTNCFFEVDSRRFILPEGNLPHNGDLRKISFEDNPYWHPSESRYKILKIEMPSEN